MRRRLVCLLLALLCLGFEWPGRLVRLERELRTAEPARRREVVRMLGAYPATEVEHALLMGLQDADPKVRIEAAASAGRVGLQAGVPILGDWLDDPDPKARVAAARALGRIGDADSAPALFRLLGDGDATVRLAAVTALSSIGTPEVVVPLLGRLEDADISVRREAIQALGRIGDPRAVVPIIGRARDDAMDVRKAAYAALGELSDVRAVPALVQGMDEGTAAAQLAAVAALGRIGSESALDALASHLKRPDARMGKAIMAALGHVEGARARELIVRHIQNPQLTKAGIDALVSRIERAPGHEGEEAARIATTLNDALAGASDVAAVRGYAQALLRISAHTSIESATGALLRAFRTRPEARHPLMRALAATGSRRVLIPLLERLQHATRNSELTPLLDAISTHFQRTRPDGRAADPLLEILPHVSDHNAVRIVRLLGHIGTSRALPVLRDLLAHPASELRLAAIDAIGAIGDAESTRALLPLLEDGDPHVRFAAARALPQAGGAELARILLERLSADRPLDRHAVLAALGGTLYELRASGATLARALKQRALEQLARATRSDDHELAAAAIDALHRWGTPEAARPIAALLRHPSKMRRARAALALGAFDTPAVRRSLRFLARDAPVEVAAAAAAALGEVGETSDAATLLRMAERRRWPVPAAAAFGLARLGRRGLLDERLVLPALCELGGSREPYVRANVAIALASVGAGPCPNAHPARWLEAEHAPVVRAAAARWLASMPRREGEAKQSALASCAERDLEPAVETACRHPVMPPWNDHVDVYAYGTDGETPLRHRLVALRLADGSAFVGYTDANAHLRLSAAPSGPLLMDDPSQVPLEPPAR